MTHLPQTLSTHPSRAAEEPYWFWGQRSPGSNVPKPFLIYNSRMPWPTFLKLGPHIRPGQQRNPIGFGITGSKVAISQNEFLLHTFVQLILNRLIQFNKTSVTKKSLGDKHFLFKLIQKKTEVSVFNIIVLYKHGTAFENSLN